jgi:hypothetical protein
MFTFCLGLQFIEMLRLQTPAQANDGLFPSETFSIFNVICDFFDVHDKKELQ